jgi:hypothetical protein
MLTFALLLAGCDFDAHDIGFDADSDSDDVTDVTDDSGNDDPADDPADDSGNDDPADDSGNDDPADAPADDSGNDAPADDSGNDDPTDDSGNDDPADAPADDSGNDDPADDSYMVSTSAGSGGTINPSSSSVSDGDTASFTLSPDSGYSIGSVSGCGGSLSGNTYTTGPVTADCTVSASFQADALPTLSISNGSVVEGDRGSVVLTLQVSLSEVANSDVNVDYATSDITATAGSDYTAASGTLTIPAASTSAEISISVSGDTVYEPAESFNVTLTHVSANATLGTASAIGTITNDDPGDILGDGEAAVTAIYTATVTHAEAPRISSGIISDPEERKRWSSNVALSAGYHEYWVAADVIEGGGSGTENDPWDLYSALKKRDIIPGNSIIWLKEGDYFSPVAGSFSAEDQKVFWPIKLQGTSGNPIHIRPEHGAKVRVDGGPIFWWPDGANHVWLWDIEFTSLPSDDWRPKPDYHIPVGTLGGDVDQQFYLDVAQYIIDNGSYSRPYVQIDGGDDNRVINTTVHGLSMGIGSWKRGDNNVVYGNVIYDNGYVSSVRPHGPGIYAQNISGTPRYLNENIVAGNLSNPFQLYSRTNPDGVVSGFNGIGNIVFGSRKLADGEAPFKRRTDVMFGDDSGTEQVFRENYIYGQELETGSYDATDLVFEDNYAIYSKTSDCLACSGNGNVVENIPTTQRIHIRPNVYDPRKAHMVVINPDRDPVISISLGDYAEAGDYIEVYNAIDLTVDAEPIVKGIYDGAYFNLPMPGSSNPYWVDWPWNGGESDNPADSEEPFDFSTVKHEFWAFVLIKEPI